MFGGNRDKFKLFYDGHYNLVYKVVSEKVSEGYARQEIIQNTFIHLWKHHKQVLKSENPNSIILKTIFQEISNYFRKNPVQNPLNNVDFVDSYELDIEQKLKTEDLLSKIPILLNQLPEKRKVIFTKSRLENKTYREIGEEFNMSPSAVENQIRKTLDYLRANLT